MNAQQFFEKFDGFGLNSLLTLPGFINDFSLHDVSLKAQLTKGITRYYELPLNARSYIEKLY